MNSIASFNFDSAKAPSLMDRKVADIIVGETPVMQQVRSNIALIGQSDAPVLIQGETGTGKELVAQALHAVSGRSGELVAVNCAAIPADLLESELFGHEKGAFTGAETRKIGRFEQAHGGTLFLDEIGDMPATLQAKLLRVLETRKVRRIGAAQETEVDFRLVTATHRNLTTGEVEFREDLYFRVAVFQISLPKLTQRVSDIPLILDRMLRQAQAKDPQLVLPHFDQSAIRALCAHPWRGNIRELRNTLVRSIVLFPGQMINEEKVRTYLLCADMSGGALPMADTGPALPEAQGLPNAGAFRTMAVEADNLDMRRYLRDIEVALIEAALDRTEGCVSRAADNLRLRRTTLIEKMKKYGINRE